MSVAFFRIDRCHPEALPRDLRWSSEGLRNHTKKSIESSVVLKPHGLRQPRAKGLQEISRSLSSHPDSNQGPRVGRCEDLCSRISGDWALSWSVLWKAESKHSFRQIMLTVYG
ncbi:hypothetical protein L798_11511 [Zootermopsis nevadensis]|uniref:Uncharacterized protein n=1 Tax=Zootermopsis nevadensis TaxID=136037 RepID=A0A067QZ05_ZOONE|nr:hypothetical protein L798_11511 [Zootermopsis nevadensis]